MGGGGEGGEERKGCEGGGEGEGASTHSGTGLWLAMTPAGSMRVVTVYNIQYTEDSVLCTLNSLLCTVYNTPCTLY